MKRETLTEKERALAYLSASVVSGCRPCLITHIEKSKILGIPSREIEEAIKHAFKAAGSSLRSMMRFGIRKLNHDLEIIPQKIFGNTSPGRSNIIISVVSTYLTGDRRGFKSCLQYGKQHGFSEEDFITLTDIAWTIREKAQYHLDKCLLTGNKRSTVSCCE